MYLESERVYKDLNNDLKEYKRSGSAEKFMGNKNNIGVVLVEEGKSIMTERLNAKNQWTVLPKLNETKSFKSSNGYSYTTLP